MQNDHMGGNVIKLRISSGFLGDFALCQNPPPSLPVHKSRPCSLAVRQLRCANFSCNLCEGGWNFIENEIESNAERQSRGANVEFTPSKQALLGAPRPKLTEISASIFSEAL